MSSPLKEHLTKEGPVQTGNLKGMQFAKNDRLDSVKLGNGPYHTDYTTVSRQTFVTKDILKPEENSETMKLKITHDHTHHDPTTDRN